MIRKLGHWVMVLAFLVFLCSVAWVYLSNVSPLAGKSGDTSFYPGPYPLQFLPVLVEIPAPTPVPSPTPIPPTPEPTPKPPPLHLGLQLGWDGTGYINFDGYLWKPGTHTTREVDQVIDADTVRIYGNATNFL